MQMREIEKNSLRKLTRSQKMMKQLNSSLDESLANIESQKADIIEFLNEKYKSFGKQRRSGRIAEEFCRQKREHKNEISANSDALKMCESQLEKCVSELSEKRKRCAPSAKTVWTR
ncbi:MAG: hypothetical protein L6V93_06815 [Clostridiales bacterium]|nr:MAG: hypothetical protein L6V93_06815 [Clostridiales bacterium]